MLTYEPFSIVIVPFPFTDKHQVKRRPALVLSSKDFQKDTGHVTLLMITSAKHSAWKNDYLLVDLNSAGLESSSIVRQKIFTIDSSLILGAKGKLAIQDENAIKKILRMHFSFCD